MVFVRLRRLPDRPHAAQLASGLHGLERFSSTWDPEKIRAFAVVLIVLFEIVSDAFRRC